MSSLKERKAAPCTFPLFCFLISSMLALIFLANWHAKSILSILLYDDPPAEREAGQYLDLFGNSDPGRSKSCLPYIFYDKPIKTGSTTVKKALLEYFFSTGEGILGCGGKASCGLAAEQVCLGARAPGHMINHVRANSSVVNCLHGVGYYHVTSIREPKARILSTFKYNKETPGRHYGIEPDLPFEEFLKKFPRCVLHNYYDGLPSRCDDDKEAIEERSENIASRMDEIIELTEEPASDLHRRIRSFLGLENVVTLVGSDESEFLVPDEVAEAEYILYNKLRERRVQLARHPGRMLCEL